MSIILGRRRYVSGGGYLLDTYSADVAYSLRKLKTGATYACKIRRDSDNATCDILLEASGSITLSSSIANLSGGSGSTLGAWITTDNGFVHTWYDQSGNGLNAVQTTTTNQPQIVTSGVINTQNSQPTLSFSKTTRSYLDFTTSLFNGTYIDFYCVSKITTFDTFGSIFLSSTTGNNVYWQINQSYDFYVQGAGGIVPTIDPAFSQHLFNLYSDASNIYAQYDTDGINSLATSPNIISSGSLLFSIGRYTGGSSQDVDGDIQEMIIYSSRQAGESSIRSNINSFYTIY